MKNGHALSRISWFYATISITLGFAGPYSEYWTITDVADGGRFEGDITVPVLKNAKGWRLSIKFDGPIKGFKVYRGDFVKESGNGTLFEIKNLPWNSALVTGENLYISVVGYAKKGLPSVRIRFQGKSYGNTEESDNNILRPGFLRKLIDRDIDHEKAVKMSLLFFDAQRSGWVSNSSRVGWKKDSALYDGGIEGIDLTGGFYTGGDFVKFNFPMAFAITQLVWGALEFGKAYESANEMENLFKIIKWGTDYFIKCHPKADEYYAMIGDPDIEHKFWESSSAMNWKRPAFKITKDQPGSDLAAETSAALAAAAILFEGIAPEYALELEKHARGLFNFADNYRGKYDDSVPQVARFYKSSGYIDELVWAALWMYKRTGKERFLNYANENYPKIDADLFETNQGFSYDNKVLGIQLLMAELTNDYNNHVEPINIFCESPGGSSTFIMPDGFLYKESVNGPIPFVANAAFICAIAASRDFGSQQSESLYTFTISQVNRILGAQKLQSFMVGFGREFPTKPHHRDSSCPTSPARCGWEIFNTPGPNSHQLNGAIVGGPNSQGVFQDSRGNYQRNQPNILINSAFQSALAAIIAHDKNVLEGSGDGAEGSGFGWDPQVFSSLNLINTFDNSVIENFDACISNPCQNSAKCITIGEMDFFCRCLFNTVGRFCEKKLNPQMEWITTWETGAQIHIHLPDSMKILNRRLRVVWPPNCPITTVKVWNTCIIPSQSSMTNRSIVFQQVSWQNDLKFIGMTFEFQAPAYYGICLKTENFRFKIKNIDIEDDESSSYTPENCPKNIPYLPPTEVPKTTPTFQTILPLGASTTEISTTETQSKYLEDSTSPIQWINTWGSGGQAHINIAAFEPSSVVGWNVRVKFPNRCKLSNIRFWNGCAVPQLSKFDDGVFVLEQVGWQLEHDFIGMTVNFVGFVSNPVDCLNVDSYSVLFKEKNVIHNEDPRFCPKSFNLEFDSVSNDSSQINLAIGNNHAQNVWLSGDAPLPVTGVNGLKATVVAPNTIQLTWKRVGEGADKLEITYTPFTTDEKKREIAAAVIKRSGSEDVNPFTSDAIALPKLDVSIYKSKTYIKKLKPGNRYQFKIRALEGKQEGPTSTVSVAIAPNDVTEVRSRVIDSRSLFLEWKKPLGVQKSYEISYYPEEPNAFPKSPYEVNGNKTSSVITGLSQNTEYVIIIRVKGYDGMSDGQLVFTKTDETSCKYLFCANNAECVPTNTESMCRCKFGFQGDGNIGCYDEDECKSKNDCDDFALCINTIGSYKCDCKLGYAGNGWECADINECVAYNGICPTSSTCKNLMGSFDCICDHGFILKHQECVDLDECEVGNRRCPRGSTCVNSIGSYTCLCPEGFEFHENNCHDINECKSGHDCPLNSHCVNREGSYHCVCPRGFVTNKDGSCSDINECKQNKKICYRNSKCRNKVGGFRCECNPGYFGLFCTSST